MFVINGMQVYSNPNLVEETETPRRVHQLRHRMKRSYHERIQKKWNKRFGFNNRPVMYQSGRTIFAHPAIVERLKMSPELDF